VPLTALLALSVLLTACDSNDDEPPPPQRITVISTPNRASHFPGETCGYGSSCHDAENVEIGAFTLSGTVYDFQNLTNEYTNARVLLYTGPNATGEPVLELAVDQSGSFYTTEPIDWNQPFGLYPVLEDLGNNDRQGNPRRAFMPKPVAPIIRESSCNGCHDGGDNPDPTLWGYTATQINNGVLSYTGGALSHNTGTNCMDSTCHGAPGDPSTVVFSTAGTVYDAGNTSLAYLGADATIGLFPNPCTPDENDNCTARENLLETFIAIDRLGNFYTTQPVDFTQGIHATIQSYATDPPTQPRNTYHMDSTATTTGDCSTCHGATRENIYID
jgi:hypothetical protein